MTASIDVARGTPEAEWTQWAAAGGTACFPALDVEALAAAAGVVVLAAHPDDEVLGVAGLVCLLAAAGARLRFIWATDGEASHPASQASVVQNLPTVRAEESTAALAMLGAGHAARTRLRLPDGGLAGRQGELVDRLSREIDPGDVVLAPWSGDAHPDHEVCGRAARAVSDDVVEYPVWAWHWARPDDDRVPWERACLVPLAPDVMARKASAIACFVSQIAPIGPDAADGPVLPAAFLAHFDRSYEVVLR